MENKIIKIPAEFRVPDTRLYPGDNSPDFELWYSQNASPIGDRYYLGVLWTSFYKMACDYGNKKEPIRRLQLFLSRLDKSKKYYTIVQYDDGILNNIDHLDCKVFAMSGNRIDYPLPLICQPHSWRELHTSRPYIASFVGAVTHPIRSEIVKIKKRGWYIDTNRHKMNFYCSVIANSIFTLCPRGYGPTSFRIMEALQYGSIPVYISDEFIEPHGMNFSNYGIKVHSNELWNLVNILENVHISEVSNKSKYANYFFHTYFTFEGNKKMIEQNL